MPAGAGNRTDAGTTKRPGTGTGTGTGSVDIVDDLGERSPDG